MANQMIALGVRGPQLPNLGAAAAQMGNVMANMAIAKEKQAGIQRANAFRQLISSPQFDPSNPEHIKAAQSLDPAGTEKIISGYDSRQKAQLERIGEQTKQFRDILVTIDPADKESYTQFRADVVAAVPGWGKFLPTPEQWGPDARLRTLMKAQNVIDKTVPTPTATVQYDEYGNAYEGRVGGLGPKGMIPLDTYEKAPPRKGTVTVEPSQTVEPGVGGPLEAAPMSTAPMMPGAKSPRLSADLASPLLNVRDEASYQQALQMIGNVNPNAANQLRRIMPRFDPARMEGIREAAFAEFEKVPQPSQGLVAGERGGVGGPDETVDGFINTGRQFRGKPPLQSPAPGIYGVNPNQVRTTAGAEKSGQEEASYIADLRKNLPQAKGALNLATKQLDRDLADIDYVLSNPYREKVVGQLEGMFPAATSVVNLFRSGGQDAQNVQDRLDKITSSSVVKHLQEMKAATPQGTSLFGNVTEYEDRLVKALAGLKQTQDEATFDRALRDYREVLVEMRQNLPQVFQDTYSRVGGKASVPPVALAPRSSPTISDVEYLRRNRNNPNVVNGFRKHFGERAYNTAIGVR